MLCIIGTLASVAAILASCHALCNAEKIILFLLKASGWGFLVYHSDSQKYFYSLTYKDAIEWLECSLGDACIFSNRTKDAVAIKLV